MSKTGKSRTPLIVGIIAAVVILAGLLVVLLTQCTGTQTATTNTTAPTQQEITDVTLYWNIDRAQYDGKSEAGMSSRTMGSDGYYHIRFFVDGSTVELKAADKRIVNDVEVRDLMGLVVSEDGVIEDVIAIEDMPLTKIGWKFYVQSVGGKTVKLNSSNKFDGMEIVLKIEGDAKAYDMSPNENGIVGKESMPEVNDRVVCVGDLEGNLVAIYIYDSSQRIITFNAECEHCKAQVEWIQWTSETTLPTAGGHYKLMNDIKLKGQQNIKADAKICLDLGGKRVDSAEGKRVYSIANLNGELAIMDTSEEKTGCMASHGTYKDQGAIVFIRYGALYLYDGILDGSDAVTTSTSGSTTVYIAADRYFFMHGGELIGGDSMYTVNEKTGKYQASLGATMMIKGKFVMNDGIIRDGHAKSVSYMSGTSRKYERGIGGNLFVSSSGIVEINGGTIKNGKAGTGGNIFMDGTAELTINGGTISGGRTTDPGRSAGNIYIGAKATAEINGGTISGGTTYGTAGNIHLLGSLTFNGGYVTGGKVLDTATGKMKAPGATAAFNLYVANGSKFAMYGGKITGGVAAVDTSKTDKKHTQVVLSGYATIDGAPKKYTNLNIQLNAEPVQVLVGNLYDSAKIGITAVGVFTKPTKETNVDSFYSDVADAEILYYDNCIALGKLACLCGSENHFGACDGKQLVWGPWTANSTLPTATGNYYLTQNVTRVASVGIGSSTNADVLVNLNLNGKTADFARRVATIYGNMNIVDHVGGGKLLGGAPLGGKDHTGVILMAGTSNVSLYGGTVALREEHSTATTGGVFGVAATATLNIYGGTVDGSNAKGTFTETVNHEATETEEAWTETITKQTTVGKGGAIRVTGTLNMTGGTVIGGSTNNGGTIYAEKNAVLNLAGGTIKGGEAVAGGNIYLDGNSVLMLDGATVTGGKTRANDKNDTSSSNGGNIHQAKGATIKMLSGSVENGFSANGGGNLYVSGKVEISGGKIAGGESSSYVQRFSKNLMAVNANISFSGGTIEGHVSLVSNGNPGASFTVSGKPVLAGGEYNLRLVSTDATKYARPVVTVDGVLEEGAKIVINETGVVSGETVEANVKAFACTDPFNTAILTEDSTVALGYVHCLCGDDTHKSWCDGKDLLWQPWDGKAFKTSGNYYLADNMTVGQASVSSSGVPATVNLDLNGKTLEGTSRAILTYANLNIVDSATGGTILGNGVINDDGTAGHTGTILMAKGSVVNLYEGTVTVNKNHKALTNGGVIGVGGGATLNIYPDAVVDGTNANVSDYAGTIRVTGTLNILGGTVMGGNAVKGGAIGFEAGGKANMTSGLITGGKASTNGGSIYMPAGTEMTVTGGTIENGESVKDGGNVYMNKPETDSTLAGPVFTLGGDAILTGGRNTGASMNAGNVYIHDAGEFIVEGNAQVTNGNAVNGGGNFYVNGTLTVRENGLIKGGVANAAAQQVARNVMINSGTLNLAGGEIEGYVSVINSGKTINSFVNISGSPKLNKGETNLRLTYTGTGVTQYPQITVKDISGENMIGIRLETKDNYKIDGKANTGLFVANADGASAAGEKFFYADAPTGGKVVLMEDGLNVHGEGYRVACACGGRLENVSYHTCKEQTWKPWKTANALPKTGYYYLSTDISGAKELSLTGTTTDTELGIDLNGHTIGSVPSGNRIFRLLDNSTTDNTYKYVLTITDNGNGQGKMIPANNQSMQGTVIWITEKNQTVNFYGGTVDGTGIVSKNGNPGMMVSVNRGTFNMYGGTIIGGTYNDSSATNPSRGAALGISNSHNGGTANLYGGTIVSGTATYGNGIYVDKPTSQGTPVLNLGGTTVGDIFLNEGIKLGLLESFTAPTTPIKLEMETPAIFAEGVETDLSEAFKAGNIGYAIRYNADKTLEMFEQHQHCSCVNAETLPEGHVCNDKQIWQPIASSAANPFVMQDGGHYHLDWTGVVAKKIEVPAGATVYLCLADATIRAQNTIDLGEGSKIVICSCGNNGTISTTKFSPLIVDQNATAILMSGTVNGTNGNTASIIPVKVEVGATFEMYGGTITGGNNNPNATNVETSDTYKSRGGNICISGNAKLMGGTITGGKYGTANRDVTVFSSNNVTVGGTVKIGYMMLFNSKLNVNEKDLDCQIGITTTATNGVIGAAATDVSSHFTSVHKDYDTVGWVNGNLVLGNRADHQHCFCAGAEALPASHKCDTLAAWTAVEKKSGSRTALADGGHYYLNWTGSSPQTVEIAENTTVYLCLNGAKIYATECISVGAGATVHICDCSAEGKGTITVSGSSNKAPITTEDGQTFHLYGGNITGTANAKSLATVSMTDGSATFNMYGGSLYNGYKNNVYMKSDGATSTFNMYGGLIHGAAEYNVAMSGGTTKFNMHGGTISNTTHANVYMSGGTATFTMNGGTIKDGKRDGDNGGNIYISGKNCKFYLNDGLITGGQAVGTSKFGGNVCMSKGYFEMNGGKITAGFATNKGGNVMIITAEGTDTTSHTAEFVMNGGEISGGSANLGANISVNARAHSTAKFTMNGGTVKDGNATTSGGNFYLYSAKDTLIINAGAVITGGTAATGPSVYNNGGTVTVDPSVTVDVVNK